VRSARSRAPLAFLVGLVLIGAGCSPAGLLARAERSMRTSPVGTRGGGCGDFTSEPRPVSVIVVDEDNQPLDGLKVACVESPVKPGRTDKRGQVTLDRTQECSDVCGCHTTCDQVEIDHPVKRSLNAVADIRGDAVRIILAGTKRDR